MKKNKYRIIWTKDVKTCAHCDRENLKGTYRIDFNTGAQYFGQICARKQGYTQKDIKIAKSKENKKYDQIGFLNDKRQKEINKKISNTSIREKEKIKKEFN